MKSEVKHVVAVCSTKIRYYYERGPWGSEVDPALGRGRGDLSLTNCSIRFRSIMGTYLKLFYNGHYCGGTGAGCGVWCWSWGWCWGWCQSTETLIVFSKQSVTHGGESLPLSQLWRPSYLVFSSFVWRWANYLPYLKVRAEMCPDREGLDQWIRPLLQMWTVVML